MRRGAQITGLLINCLLMEEQSRQNNLGFSSIHRLSPSLYCARLCPGNRDQRRHLMFAKQTVLRMAAIPAVADAASASADFVSQSARVSLPRLYGSPLLD